MRILIALFFLFFCVCAKPSEVNCYSGKTRIYHGYGNNFMFNNDFMVFTETASTKMIVSTADCLVIVRVGEKFDASSEG
jgi:hypothetical protein